METIIYIPSVFLLASCSVSLACSAVLYLSAATPRLFLSPRVSLNEDGAKGYFLNFLTLGTLPRQPLGITTLLPLSRTLIVRSGVDITSEITFYGKAEVVHTTARYWKHHHFISRVREI